LKINLLENQLVTDKSTEIALGVGAGEDVTSKSHPMKPTSYSDHSFTAVADCGDAVMVQVPGPVPFSSLLKTLNPDAERTVKPLQLSSKKIREACVKLAKHLSGHNQDSLVSAVFAERNSLSSISDEQFRIVIHLDGDENTNISDDLFGEFWLYLRRTGQCKSSKKDIERFIQAYFSSRGNFTGIYRILCRAANWNREAAIKNPLIVAYERLLKGKEIQMITHNGVANQ
jgi:hypothetical protein